MKREERGSECTQWTIWLFQQCQKRRDLLNVSATHLLLFRVAQFISQRHLLTTRRNLLGHVIAAPLPVQFYKTPVTVTCGHHCFWHTFRYANDFWSYHFHATNNFLIADNLCLNWTNCDDCAVNSTWERNWMTDNTCTYSQPEKRLLRQPQAIELITN